MYCPNCGYKLNGNEDFYSNCGINLKTIETGNISSITSEKKYKKWIDSLKTILNNLKFLCRKYKKLIIISLSLCSIVIIGITLFINFYDFTTINWDLENGDINITHSQPTTIELNVLAYDKKENPIYDIKFSATGGNIESYGATVSWALPSEDGIYTITAEAPSDKKITKKVEVVNLKIDDNILLDIAKNDANEQTVDSDGDGLTDDEEKKMEQTLTLPIQIKTE